MWDRRPCLSPTRERCARATFSNPEDSYRRKLPHLRQDHAAYFVTWRLANGQPKLDSRERELVMAAIRNFAAQRYNLSDYVITYPLT